MTASQLGYQPHEYFYDPDDYGKKIWIKGTLVKFSDEYVSRYTRYGRVLHPYARFAGYTTDRFGTKVYWFGPCPTPYSKQRNMTIKEIVEDNTSYTKSECAYVHPYAFAHGAIEEIIEGESYEVDLPVFKCMQKDWEDPNRLWAAIIAIVAMIGVAKLCGIDKCWPIELLIVIVYIIWRNDYINS